MTTQDRQKRAAPLSIRLNETEFAKLRELAGKTPLSTYIKAKTLGGTPVAPQRRTVDADRAQLAQVLGQLGASGLSTSMKVLADAAASGSLYVDSRTASELRQACGHISEMRAALMRALYGGRGSTRPAPPVRLDELFNSLNASWESDA